MAFLIVHQDFPLLYIGSKEEEEEEEMFFDSQPWLESDCEDDFYSIKGGEIDI